MCTRTIQKLTVMIVLGLGTFVALAFTDFGLSGGALAGIFTLLAAAHEGRRRKCRQPGVGS